MLSYETFITTNPYNGEPLAEYPVLTTSELRRKVDHAEAAWVHWQQTTFDYRAGLIRRLAELLMEQRDRLALLITTEMGKHIREARAEVEKCTTACHYYADHAAEWLAGYAPPTPYTSRVVHQPIGAVLGIMPWNFPLWQVFRFSMPALMAGNVVLLKHAPNVSGCSLAIEQLMLEAGVPQGVFQSLIVQVEAVSTLMAEDIVQGVALTGSERAGATVAAQAGSHIKKCVLELGGSDAVLVLDDADLDKAAQVAVQSRMMNAGQSCIAAKRFLVTARNAEAFTEKVFRQVQTIRQGNPLDETVQMGPMARPDLAENLYRQYQTSVQQGAYTLIGGAYEGCNFQPTLITETNTAMPVFTEETFGPLASVFITESEQQMVTLANQSRYGLGATIFTQDRTWGESVALRLQCGNVFINNLVRSDVRMPFGGVKKSGFGRELAAEGIREFTNIKTIVTE